MLTKEELRLLNEILSKLELEGDSLKLQTKLSLIIEQIDIMEKSQEEVAKVQDKIKELEEK